MPSAVENCLTLDVYSPKNAAYQTRLTGSAYESMPVAIFLHGFGHGLAGSGSQSMYDGSRFASEHKVVVIVPNFRLGPLGFLAHAGLSNRQGGTSGNYGLLDQ